MALVAATILSFLLVAEQIHAEQIAKLNVKLDTKVAALGMGDTYRCFTVEGEPGSRCFSRMTFNEIVLREGGEWSNDTIAAKYYVGLLSRNSRAIQVIKQSHVFKIHDLAMSDNGSFVVDITFNYGPDQQVNHVFGEIRRGASGQVVVVTAYADAKPEQERVRWNIKNFENNLNPSRNFQQIFDQVRLEDLIRVQAVEPILADWVLTMGALASRIFSKPHRRVVEVNAEAKSAE